MNEYTGYILNKCLNDKKETLLHTKIELLAHMKILGLLPVRTFISEVEDAVSDWVIEMLENLNDIEILAFLMAIDSKPKSGITRIKPEDDAEKFYKHAFILKGVDFDQLAFQIFNHYKKEVKNNGNK